MVQKCSNILHSISCERRLFTTIKNICHLFMGLLNTGSSHVGLCFVPVLCLCERLCVASPLQYSFIQYLSHSKLKKLNIIPYLVWFDIIRFFLSPVLSGTHNIVIFKNRYESHIGLMSLMKIVNISKNYLHQLSRIFLKSTWDHNVPMILFGFLVICN